MDSILRTLQDCCCSWQVRAVDPQELGFNAWVLIGNVLAVSTGGAGSHRMPVREPQLMKELAAALSAVPPAGIVAALQRILPEQRALLWQAVEECYAIFGTDAASVLGMDRGEADEVLSLLRD